MTGAELDRIEAQEAALIELAARRPAPEGGTPLYHPRRHDIYGANVPEHALRKQLEEDHKNALLNVDDESVKRSDVEKNFENKTMTTTTTTSSRPTSRGASRGTTGKRNTNSRGGGGGGGNKTNKPSTPKSASGRRSSTNVAGGGGGGGGGGGNSNGTGNDDKKKSDDPEESAVQQKKKVLFTPDTAFMIMAVLRKGRKDAVIYHICVYVSYTYVYSFKVF
jgi:hypothetical protein